MTVASLLLRLRDANIEVSIAGNDLQVLAPPGALTEALRRELTARKQEILQVLREIRSSAAGEHIPRISRDSVPLSFAQEGLWFFERLQPGTPTFSVPTTLRLRGQLDRQVLADSLSEIVCRHESLRTTFDSREGEPIQLIGPAAAVELPVIDLRMLAEPERETAWHEQVSAEAQRPFDLLHGPLIRCRLWALADDEHVLQINVHHIAADGWSLGILARELETIYTNRCGGTRGALPELPVQYADVAAWERAVLAGDTYARLLAFWRTRLQGALALQLPTDRPRPPARTSQGDVIARLLPRTLQDRARTLSAAEKGTLFMILFAAFNVLLYRYTAEEDLVVGTPVATRSHADSEALIGCFVNLLPIRVNLAGRPTFLDVFRSVRKTLLDAFAHQQMPFERLVRELRPNRGAAASPFVQVVFAYQNAWLSDFRLPGVTASYWPVSTRTAKYELTLIADSTPDGLRLFVEYSTDLFDSSTIERLLDQYTSILEAVVALPDRRVDELPLVAERERQRLVEQGTGPAADYPRGQSLATVFEAQARQTPTAVAATCDGHHLTYDDLNRRANRLARRLKAQGVGPDVLVAVALDRSLELLVALLAVAKAGGAYVPLDLAYPKARLAFMLADARAPLVLTLQQIADALPSGESRHLYLDDEALAIVQQPDDDLPAQAGADDLAYVMYTSGSTGQPKGVAVPHRGVVRLVRGTDYVRWSDVNAILHMAPISFDASTFEIWGALLNGKRTVLIPDRLVSFEVLERTLRAEHVDCMFLTTALFNAIMDTRPGMFGGVRQLLFGGEAVSVEHVRRAIAHLPGTQLGHVYGPTEATTFASYFPVPRVVDPHARSIPIGRPIANTQLHILDRHGVLVPVGVAGELYIGGDGLAREYLNQPAITAERFVPDPFSARPGARLYRTGDLVRRLNDGNIEFLGRLDRQVKLRGFRIEPGEIESALRTSGEVRDAVVEIQTDTGSPHLTAYVVPVDGSRLSPASMRDWLQSRLPEYMVPSEFVVLPAIPRTANGKVDRTALPVPVQTPGDQRPSAVAPQTVEEQKLAAIWSEVLGVPSVGVHDDFFEIGGHSLAALRVFAQIEKTLGAVIPLSALYEAPTISRLAGVVRAKKESEEWPAIVVINEGTGTPIVCVHSISGDTLEYRGLSKWLGPEQSVVGVQAKLGRTDGDLYETIETTAAAYVAELRAFQPTGPYSLAGLSSGGTLALEMARQLLSAGQQIGLLAIMDNAPGNTGVPLHERSARNLLRQLANLPRWVRDDLLVSPPSDVFWRVRRWIAGGLRKVRTAVFKTTDKRSPSVRDVVNFPPRSARWERFVEKHYRALLNYVPRPYPGRVTLFKARTHPLLWLHDSDRIWRRIAPDVEVHIVPGTHLSLLREPHVRVLAAVLKDVLARARGGFLAGVEILALVGC